VLRRTLPAALAVAAALADAAGAHGLAFDALLGAIPFAAVAGLEVFGAYLDDRRESLLGLQALLWSLALALLVLSCAARSPAGETHALPALGWSALVASLVVFGVKAALAAAPQLRRLALVRPAKP
jgi:hypothetical protein